MTAKTSFIVDDQNRLLSADTGAGKTKWLRFGKPLPEGWHYVRGEEYDRIVDRGSKEGGAR